MTADEIRTFIETAEFRNEKDRKKQTDRLAQWLSEERERKKHAVKDIDDKYTSGTPESHAEYMKWDQQRAQEIMRGAVQTAPTPTGSAPPGGVPPPPSSD